MENDSQKSAEVKTVAPSLFVNRELSWLAFNQRVLCESASAAAPLLERLKFASIYASNLDEFFMIRVGSLSDQTLMKPEKRDEMTGMIAEEQITAIFETVTRMNKLCESSYQQLCLDLQKAGIDFLDGEGLSNLDELICQKYFHEEIAPLLSPQIIDPHHPFPFLKSNDSYLALSFENKSGTMKLGIIPLSHLPAFFLCEVKGRQKVIFTPDLVRRHAQELYPKYPILEKHLIRVTRNADIAPNEGLFDYDVDYRDVMEDLLKQRKRLAAVRLQISGIPTRHFVRTFCKHLGIDAKRSVTSSIPLDLDFVFPLVSQLKAKKPELLFPERKPSYPTKAAEESLFRTIGEKDVLLAYPFQSIRIFSDYLLKAADDPSVVSIKISLYRLANNSRIASALARAADNGKEVLCVLELRARFDEQNNIDYAKMLEDAGCTVIYGLSKYKVHAKLCLITRKSHGKIRYITQIGTGNYNEKTAEQYTDLSLITGDEAVGRDANAVFNALCIGELAEDICSLWVAPNHYLSNLLAEIQQEIDWQKSGGQGYICIKVNSMNDLSVMKKLIEASQAGVRIELFIRGICCLRPGIAGFTESITVRSIVGRFLEHSRILAFGQGNRQRLYIGSGDLLKRNTTRRVEVFVQIRSQTIQAELLQILDVFRRDTENAWDMQPDGSYRQCPDESQPPLNSQMWLYDEYANQTNQKDSAKAQGIFSRARQWFSR